MKISELFESNYIISKTVKQISHEEFTSEERAAVREYQHGAYNSDVGGFSNLQSILRGKEPTWPQSWNAERGLIHIKNLKSAFNKSKTTSPLILHRGVRVQKANNEILNLSVGAEFTEMGITSATTSTEVVKRFGNPLNKSDINLQLKIFVPAGVKALSIDDFNNNNEKEVALSPGTKFKIKSKKILDSKNILMNVDVIGQKTLTEDTMPRYITDNNDQNPDQDEKNRTYAIKVAKFLKEHCQSWLSQTNNGYLTVYRGLKGLGEEADNLAFIKDVRLDRKPKDTAPSLHNLFNDLIAKAGKVANRSNSMFVTGSPSRAKEYGKLFVIFPIGNFNYTWSYEYEDWYNDAPADDPEFEYFFPKYIEGDDDTLKKAVESNNEIMIKCKAAVYINDRFFNNYVLPLMSGNRII
jgi:hypothetical protein